MWGTMLKSSYAFGKRRVATQGAGFWSRAANVAGFAAGDPAVRTMGMGAGIGATLGGAYGIVADDTSMIGGAFGGAVLGAMGGAGVRYGGMGLRKGGRAAYNKARADAYRLANKTSQAFGKGKIGFAKFSKQAAASRKTEPLLASNGGGLGGRADIRARQAREAQRRTTQRTVQRNKTTAANMRAQADARSARAQGGATARALERRAAARPEGYGMLGPEPYQPAALGLETFLGPGATSAARARSGAAEFAATSYGRRTGMSVPGDVLASKPSPGAESIWDLA